ncbi:MAG: hypothetical protein EOM23_05855 [Candidatus Moranbacteria bacterium]|nr:hypothetical protein [Candidatus Moranbacteria bacterium]
MSSFAFETEADVKAWEKKELPELVNSYGPLHIKKFKLDGLKIGDKCRVAGEGTDVFTIIGQKMFSPNRPGFLLDSGWYEEVVKCYKPENDTNC